MAKKVLSEVEFVNIRLKFSPRLYIRKEESLPDEQQLVAWLEQMACNWYRFGMSYSPETKSVVCSLTYKGGKTDEACPCVSMHGQSLLSAGQKLWLVFEYCGGAREGLSYAADALAQLETYVEDKLSKL